MAEAVPPAGQCLVALGGNLGDVAAAFRAALVRLEARGVLVTAVSQLYRTRAQLWPGSAPQPDYLNAACVVRTALTPLQVLDACQAVEAQAGHKSAARWGPRALDLDLVACKNFYLTTPRLTLPHPRAHGRSFVLLPLCDVAPDWRLEGHGVAIKALLQRLPEAVRRQGATSLSWLVPPA